LELEDSEISKPNSFICRLTNASLPGALAPALMCLGGHRQHTGSRGSWHLRSSRDHRELPQGDVGAQVKGRPGDTYAVHRRGAESFYMVGEKVRGERSLKYKIGEEGRCRISEHFLSTSYVPGHQTLC